MAQRRVTTVEVARLANVSQRTAARAFASPELVAESTRDAVYAAAAELGYVPNAIASSLKSQRSTIVAALLPANARYYQEALVDLARAIADQGYQLLVLVFEPDEDNEPALRALRSYQIDGLLLASSIMPEQLVEAGLSGTRRVVAFNDPDPPEGVPGASVDNRAGVEDLVAHLAEIGGRSIVYVNGDRSASTNRLRRAGSREAAIARGMTWNEVHADSFHYEAGRIAGQRLLEAGSMPDGVMAACDEIAFGLIDEFRSGGLRIGVDVAVTGFDGLPQSAWRAYDLTTVEQPLAVLADRAARLLDHQQVETSPVRGEIRVRRSTLG